ncbi:MAG: HlyD family efflux transporter periplasmic adaptor subunit [Immundisolibacter sp.]
MEATEQLPARRRRWRLLLFALVVLVAGVAWAAWWQLHGQYRERTENAQVAGNLLTVMPQITGTVTAVWADDTDRVRRGDLLVQLDEADARLAVASAEAALAEAAREVITLAAEREQALAAVGLAQAQLDRALADLQRRRGLVVRRSISAEELNHAELDANTARSAVRLARRRLAVAQASLGPGPLREHPRVLQAAARLREAYLQLARCRILAPADGQVAQRRVQVGQQVSPSSRLLDIVPLDAVWVEVNFKEGQLANLRLGQPVHMTSDLYGDRFVFSGRVSGIGAGTGSVFSLLPPQNATGNWIKIVQRVPVRVAIDRDSLEGRPLPLGASVEAVVDTRSRDGELVTGAPAPADGRYTTAVYAGRLAAIETSVAQRIEAAFAAVGQARTAE